MRKLLILSIFLSPLLYAGGDIKVVTPYETDDYIKAEQEAVEYVEEAPLVPLSTPEPEYIEEYSAPEPEIIPTPVATPIFVETPPREIIKEAPKKQVSRGKSPNGFYAGIGISGSRYDSSCECDRTTGVVKRVSHSEKSAAVSMRVGYDYNQYIGVEARGVKDFAEDDGASISHAGVFIKPMYHITKNLNIYGLVGLAKTKTSGSYPKVNSESLALGGGVEYDLSRDKAKNNIKYSRDFDGEGDQERGFGLFLDYERFVVEKNAPILDAVSAGLTYDF